ncbi:3' terminal RNA ribose 2'-O-methyltransferase Hen1 [Pontibacter sp. BT310]|uniref:Small RNA 2'-O-methyltransferase n=1 Tax=Pontibacter populi TaxID=890055 RepID=A0ABS6XAG6_9BACT|nr:MULTISPECIES: 3' terminal RNA ribose 2'-O-methyltransferase Hen1 [Pontibacter]MBJ6118101.1 3' terminal RNA ribose 2'-O-methyltransferase Hen1 [Pontibacter sp. BT310]MBR0570528.1 3' terminal RNA ribose 2'-O-methyltransferase Hen1 [Microvirga sp. STS03]MBW3364954.1 3' terminal RNA ribose 2'-O-methyltransferase Hen1 [Pontibacter populi]
MILEITTTHQPATDLGYLLHKHPDKVQSVELAAGKAHIFYTEATAERCTACLMLDINPVDLVRVRKGNYALQDQYVNDRPYTTNSFLSTAIAKAFGSALNGRCNPRPELPETSMPFSCKLTSLRVDAELETVERLFLPLGYALEIETIPLDPAFPGWGLSKYTNLTLSKTCTLQELLSHLYVLIPVLDNSRHSWVAQHDIEILMQKGQGWLEQHPERDWITRRFLRNIRTITSEAILRLAGEDALPPEEDESPLQESLHQQRLNRAFERLRESGATKVLDLGCGSGKLLKLLLKEGQFRKITGMDVSFSELQLAKENLYLDEASPALRQRLSLFQGSVTYLDERMKGYDAVALVEVIEHLDEVRLPAMEKVVFGYAAPETVVLSTPNAEYNVVYKRLDPEAFRHEDHRFEWTRQQFRNWCDTVGERFGYEVRIESVGQEEPNIGAPSQLAVFKNKLTL